MKNKMLMLIASAVFLFVGADVAAAKSIDISRTDVIQFDQGRTNYAQVSIINEYGMIFTDIDELDVEEQEIVTQAMNSWNSMIGRRVFATYQHVGTTKDNCDLKIEIHEGGSHCDYGYSGVGYGLSTAVIRLARGMLPGGLEPGTKLYTQAVSTTRHEMGHALGLAHDNGLVMADLYDATVNNKPEMLAAAQEAVALINSGVLPTIPQFNKDAILNLLNNRSTFYFIPNTRANQVSSLIVDSVFGRVAGVYYVNRPVNIVKNYNLYRLDFAPGDAFTGTTAGNGLVGTEIIIKEDLISILGYHYYLFEKDGIEYIVNAHACDG